MAEKGTYVCEADNLQQLRKATIRQTQKSNSQVEFGKKKAGIEEASLDANEFRDGV